VLENAKKTKHHPAVGNRHGTMLKGEFNYVCTVTKRPAVGRTLFE
jgi:hypothetical protein